MDLDDIRKEIDSIDMDIARLLQERARLAMRAGDLKKAVSRPVFDPEREKIVLSRAEQAAGPLSPAAMRRIFEEIIRQTRQAEEA